ncbi:MAG: orotate phosphoribosyltransferase [Neisseriaceae bacterium]|nr:MAG: orotate phosphoribosyltransferase [Neisseriaceae bacterium]
MSDLQQTFLQFVIDKKILKFGEFTTKFGRHSPYFFNAGLFYDGGSLYQIAHFYADTIIKNNLDFDVLFGPAYKGIVLAAITCMALAEKNINKPFAYNRKEAKDHGEKGILVGAPLKGNVLIIDDVISAGTSIRESVQLIQKENAKPVGVVLALDRMEKGIKDISAVEEVKQTYQIPVTAIATFQDLLQLITDKPELQKYQTAINAYREKYGTI